MFARRLRCVGCGTEYPTKIAYTCEKCGGILDVTYDWAQIAAIVHEQGLINASQKGIWRYERMLPLQGGPAVTLGEGATELLPCNRLASKMGAGSLYLKDETREPTGSFKDRPIALAISKALEFGVTTVCTASSGNAGASVSAYAAKAGLDCIVFVPASVPSGKLTQMSLYGPKIVAVKGSYSDAYRLSDAAARDLGWFNMTTTFLNPYPTEGNKTVAYEIAEQMGWRAPDWIVVPIGAGPLLIGIYKGFQELARLGLVPNLPKMVGVQGEGCSPVVRAFEEGATRVREWLEPLKTIASGIADPLVGYSQDGTYTLGAIRSSGGVAVSVSDQEILDTAQELGKLEGVFAEPTGTATVAAVKKLLRRGTIGEDDSVVCVVTGNGLKDISAYAGLVKAPPVVAGDYKNVASLLERA